jgi:hypothetical protein
LAVGNESNFRVYISILPSSIHSVSIINFQSSLLFIKVDEVDLKGENKEKWRHFCDYFKETVEDYNFGTMLRIKSDGIYDEANTIITTRVIN